MGNWYSVPNVNELTFILFVRQQGLPGSTTKRNFCNINVQQFHEAIELFKLTLIKYNKNFPANRGITDYQTMNITTRISLNFQKPILQTTHLQLPRSANNFPINIRF